MAYRVDDCFSNETLLSETVMVGFDQNVRFNASSNCSHGDQEEPYYGPMPTIFDQHGYIRIPLYSLIFLLSIIGNSLVFLTLIQNKRMRTVTNVFLLNLSFSDLLLSCFCMPFTLIPQLMRNFIFGEFVCISIRYLQGKNC